MSARLQWSYPDLIARLVFTGLRIGPYIVRKAQEKEEDRERKKEFVQVCLYLRVRKKKRQSWKAAHANDK